MTKQPKRTPPAIPPYNPLDKQRLGDNVADALLEIPAGPLPPEPFLGAGIYAIYYTGPFPAYAPITAGRVPIYVGKAVPEGARKGNFGLDSPPATDLFDRLKEHAASIEKAENLDLTDFSCRYLVVEDIWIPLGESLLIQRFSPLWNVVVDGFGNHDPGGGRYAQAPSPWDVLHPGRSWVWKCKGTPSPVGKVLERIERHFLSHGPVDQIGG